MLLQQDNETLVAGGLGQGNVFTIAASAKAFDILSSNLYQNKILAVIREISCNAADAHKIVGCPLRDIKVHLPTFGEPYFAVRDFGPGLSKDDVLHLYTTYFQSSKDSNNDLIGGFGLGSKSPFAIADQFTVTSWHDGMKRSYVCYKLNGVPAINVISEDASSEPTGLEVRVASDARPSTWMSEAEGYYQWWPELPTFNIGISGTNVFAKSSIVVASSELNPDGTPAWVLTRGFSSPKVFMGLVGYDLNLSAIPNLPDEVTGALSNMGIVFNLNVGDASINPSRETLSYDPATCALLTTKLKALYVSLTKDLTAALGQQPTLYEARRYLFSDGTSGGTTTSLHATIKNLLERGRVILRWRGQPVQKQVSFDGTSFGPTPASITRYSKNPYRVRWDTTHYGASSWTDRFYDTVRYFWADNVTAKTYATLKHYQTLGTSREATYCIVSGPALQTVVDTFTRLGLPPIVDVATLPAPPRAAPGSRTSSPTARAYVYDRSNGWNRSETMVDLKGGGYYCPFFDGRARAAYTERLGWLIAAGFVPADTRLVGFQTRRLDSARFLKSLTTAGWQPWDYEALLATVPVVAVEDFYYQTGLSQLSYGREIVSPIISILADSRASAITNPAFVSIRNEWLARNTKIELPYGSSFNWSTPTQTAAAANGSARVTAFIASINAAVATKPMLRYVRRPDNGNAAAAYLSDVLAYINS